MKKALIIGLLMTAILACLIYIISLSKKVEEIKAQVTEYEVLVTELNQKIVEQNGELETQKKHSEQLFSKVQMLKLKLTKNGIPVEDL